MILQLENISKSYGLPSEANYQTVLKELSLEIEDGESIAIIGPSGSGKSTLLNIIGTLDYPDSGRILFKGEELTTLSGTGLDHFRNKEIGFIFQMHHLLPQCTVLENVMIPTLVDRSADISKQSWAEELLQRVGIWEYRNKRPGQLSGGECQRVAVVRAMINKPSLLLADEPTGALDGKNVDAISELLLQLNKEEKVSLVVVTHSQTLASRMASSYELEEGSLKKK